MSVLRAIPPVALLGALLAACGAEPGPPPRQDAGKPAAPVASDARFTALALPVSTYNLFDLGVCDANDDGVADLFTVNHNARDSLLLGDGAGGFRDVLTEWGLDQDRAFPGAEDAGEAPADVPPGLAIFWRRKRLVIRARGLPADIAAGGRVVLPVPREPPPSGDWITLEQAGGSGFEVQLEQLLAEGETPTATVTFRQAVPGADAEFALRTGFLGTALRFEIDPAVPLDRVHVGHAFVRPGAHTFDILHRDRHGAAWTDWSGDGRTDVFLSRGGLRGRISGLGVRVEDELLVRSGDGFADVTESAGLVKGDCRARQATWVDLDGDGDLDLFLAAFRTPHQMFLRTGPQAFAPVPGNAGITAEQNGLIAWFDHDQDGDTDALFVADSLRLQYVNDGGKFRSRVVGEGGRDARDPPRTTVGDFDGDGDADVFIASDRRCLLLVNDGGTFREIPATERGLPERCKTANWVDFDADGRLDLHAVPGGLHRGGTDGRFTRTGQLDVPEPDDVTAARASWFDMDGDGDRDVAWVVAGTAPRGEEPPATGTLSRNDTPNGHWITVQLVGDSGNPSAIGATVILEHSDGRRQAQPVGSADGSHYSQGHYRLHFGLGDAERPQAIDVLWPGGTRQRIEAPEADRVLTIRKEL